MSDSSSNDNTGRFSCESYLMNTAVSSDRVREGATKRSGPILWGLIISFTRWVPLSFRLIIIRAKTELRSSLFVGVFSARQTRTLREFVCTTSGIHWSRSGERFVNVQRPVDRLIYLFIRNIPRSRFFFRSRHRESACARLACSTAPNISRSHPFFFPFLFLSGTLSESYVSIMKVKGQVVH